MRFYNYRILFASDIDGTLVSHNNNPHRAEHIKALNEFLELSHAYFVTMSGRTLEQSLSILDSFGIRKPNIMICGTGTEIYYRKKETYEVDHCWHETLRRELDIEMRATIKTRLSVFKDLTEQPSENQSDLKLSYVFRGSNAKRIKETIATQIRPFNTKVRSVVHIDKYINVAYLDILPVSASKESSLRKVLSHTAVPHQNVVVAGDGDNDFEVLASGFKAIVVRNAPEHLKSKLRAESTKKSLMNRIYFASGTRDAMDGDDVSGILEGLAHFGYLDKTLNSITF